MEYRNLLKLNKLNFSMEKRNISYFLSEAIKTYQGLSQQVSKIEDISSTLYQTYQNGNKILIAGNGGSAADAQHFAAELVGRYEKDRKALAALALTTNSSILTAIANDFTYEQSIKRQIEAFGEKGDCFIGISTSGNSKNLIRALEESNYRGLRTIGLLGMDGGKMKNLCDEFILVNSNSTPRIQEAHIFIIHSICSLLEDKLFP